MAENFKFDTHTHTRYSPCALTKPEELVDIALEKGLHGIVVCDHNTSKGAIIAKRYAEKNNLPIQVELGIEAATGYGEIGLKFLNEDECARTEKLRNNNGVFGFLELKEIIKSLRDETSQILLDFHHPFEHGKGGKRGGFKFEALIKTGIFKDISDLIKWFDVIEFNAGNMNPYEGAQAFELARIHKKPIVLSTDAHFPWQIGRFYTIAKNHTDIRSAILAEDTQFSPMPQTIDYLRSRMNRTLSGAIKTGREIYDPLRIL